MHAKVDFIITWAIDPRGSDVRTLASELDVAEVVREIATRNRGIAGGYVVEVGGIPWNAWVGEASGVTRYGVDSLGMAQNLLVAVVEFAETGRTTECFFWEYSNAEISPAGADAVSLMDRGITSAGEPPVFPQIVVGRAELIDGFISATRDYLNFAKSVIAEAERWIERGGDEPATARLRATTRELDVGTWERLLDRLRAAATKAPRGGA